MLRWLFRWMLAFAEVSQKNTGSVVTSRDAGVGAEALTEREQLQVRRMLSDPTYFPIEFKRWLKDYLEGQDLQILASNVNPTIVSKWGNETGLPIGSVIYFAGTTYANDLTNCDGSELSRTEYPKLFEQIGIGYGDGDGSTTFNVPNMPVITVSPGADMRPKIVKGRNV